MSAAGVGRQPLPPARPRLRHHKAPPSRRRSSLPRPRHTRPRPIRSHSSWPGSAPERPRSRARAGPGPTRPGEGSRLGQAPPPIDHAQGPARHLPPTLPGVRGRLQDFLFKASATPPSWSSAVKATLQTGKLRSARGAAGQAGRWPPPPPGAQQERPSHFWALNGLSHPPSLAGGHVNLPDSRKRRRRLGKAHGARGGPAGGATPSRSLPACGLCARAAPCA